MVKSNWIIVWHDRHRDDIYKIVLNATWDEAEKVEIEIGDFVAHPTGTYGGGSSVEVSKVDSFGVGTANCWKADRLIVNKTDNPNKKLGWC